MESERSGKHSAWSHRPGFEPGLTALGLLSYGVPAQWSFDFPFRCLLWSWTELQPILWQHKVTSYNDKEKKSISSFHILSSKQHNVSRIPATHWNLRIAPLFANRIFTGPTWRMGILKPPPYQNSSAVHCSAAGTFSLVFSKKPARLGKILYSINTKSIWGKQWLQL